METREPQVDEPAAERRVSAATYLLGTAALASGAALLVFFLTRVSLRLAFAATVTLAVVAVTVAVRLIPPDARARLKRLALVGLGAGVAATVVYDASRWALVWIFELSANPWEALPEFGRLFLGTATSDPAVWAAGAAYHVANGLGFAVAYAVIVRKPGWVTGVLWALALESLMLAFYPGWLDIRTRQEFLSVSMLGHLGYGLTLGGLVKRYAGEAGHD